MKKLFMVSIDDNATTEQRDAVTTYVNQLHVTGGVGFWHHLTSTWLIADPRAVLTTAELRDKLLELMPGVSTMVVRVAPAEWATSSQVSGHKWLHDNLDSA